MHAIQIEDANQFMKGQRDGNQKKNELAQRTGCSEVNTKF